MHRRYHCERKIPIIAGGTGLYIQSLIYNYPFEKEEITAEKKREVAKMNALEELDNDHLHQYLKTFDSKSALEIHLIIEKECLGQ